MRRVVGALGAVVVAASLAACGDKAPSNQEFFAEADPVCKRGNDAAALFTVPSDVPGMREYATKLADTTTKTADELQKLDQPKGADGKNVDAMVKAMRDAAGAARAVPAAVDKGELPAVESSAKATVDAYKAANEKARAAGSAECGQGEAASTTRLGENAGPALQKAYIGKVDPMCASVRKEFLKTEQPQTQAELVALLDKSLAMGSKLNADAKAIPQPEFEKPKLTAFYATWDEVLAKTRQLRDAAARNDEAAMEDVGQQVVELGATFSGQAGAYGFHECGQS